MTGAAGRTVLITGASSGSAERAPRNSAPTDRRCSAPAARPRDSPRQRVDGVTYLRLDYRDPATLRAVTAALPRVDVLINNAGVGAGAVEDRQHCDDRELFETNVFGPLELTRAYLPAMRAN